VTATAAPPEARASYPAGPPPPRAPVPPPPDPPRRPRVWRIVLGCAIVVLAAAVTTIVFVKEEVNTLVGDINQNHALKVRPGDLAGASFGGPETILLVGDDTRKVFKYYKGFVPDLANEMLLVRLDPNKPYISMMSIPRELWVPIYPPGRAPYTNRINSAYTFGVGTLVSTIKRDLGLSINHVVVITFDRFERAVNEMGCVYSTVDRRYYHVNVPGGEQYQEINLQPGYQNMCGSAAEQFVSYRHGDTSLVRDARDQSFLLDVKKQYGPTLSSIASIHKFERIFGRLVLTDPGLHTYNGVLNLLGTLISSASLRVRQVKFQADLLPSFDTASPQQIRASVHSFLYGGPSAPTAATAALARKLHRKHAGAGLPLIPTPPAELAQARAASAKLGFPLEFPRVEDRSAGSVPDYFRDYQIPAPGGARYQIYVSVFYAGGLGQYYDVQGTTWLTAPLFDSPEQTVRVGGRKYDLYYEGAHLKMVAWYEHGAAYWIRNTLTDTISNGELLAIAEQTSPIGTSAHPTAPGAPVSLKVGGVPTLTTATQRTSFQQSLGSLGGLVTLVLLPLLAIPLVRRRRELAALRARVHARELHEARLHAALAGDVPSSRPPTSWAAVSAGMKMYRWRRAPRRRLILVGAVVLAAGMAAGAYELSRPPAPAKPSALLTPASRARPQLPTVPVAVLNATTTSGAAGRIADQLRADKVQIGTVGNVTESRGGGVLIMYAPGAREQAARVARLLTKQSPTVAPIDPSAQAAAGATAKVVVVIA
jgi:LCP family protein required for cell wall assembly